jgi:hypothetical protein
MKIRYLLALLCVLPTWALAEIYKAVDANGHVTYSNAPLKGGRKIISSQHGQEQRDTNKAAGTSRNTASPTTFPRIDSETQKNRDNTRQKILQNELESEEKLLIEARKALKDAESAPTDPQFAAKTKSALEQIKIHEKNIEALTTELSKLK